MSSDIAAPTSTLAQRWMERWPDALACWSQYTMLREPIFYENDRDAAATGMAGQIAAIRLLDHIIMVNLQQIRKLMIEKYALEVLAHEIGHHVFVPGNLTDNARMIGIMQPIFMGMSKDVSHMVANLYGDLHINDRLQRSANLDIAGVYKNMRQDSKGETSSVWKVYTRAYEHLWSLKPGTLAPDGVTDEMNSDAALIARLIRYHGGRWLKGVQRFSFVLYPYLVADEKRKKPQTFVVLGLGDTKNAGKPGDGTADGEAIPDGLIERGDGSGGDGSDDDFDKELEAEARGNSAKPQDNTTPSGEAKPSTGGQCREPFEYGELLKALGLNVDENLVTARYYKERALPYLIPFPAKKAAQSREPLAEGYEQWDASEDLDKLDVFSSVTQSPHIIPGITTQQRVYGDVPGADPAKVPLDLDIYIDSSGSMPNPATVTSYLSLCATILALSALRMGARVQATVWSHAGSFRWTEGFIRDEKKVLAITAGYICGGTAFPIHILRDTYADRKKDDPPAHVVVISDDGVDTMLQKDEKGGDGETIARSALKAARGGGTLVLNIRNIAVWKPRATLEKIGFRVHGVTDWVELVEFARKFVRDNYE